jgi:uncharacterized protein YgiM (DUF1202 family)
MSSYDKEKTAPAKKIKSMSTGGQQIKRDVAGKIDSQEAHAATPLRKAVILARSLHVRKDHSAKTETVAGLVKGDEVVVLETDGKNTWARIGNDKWAAMESDGQKLMEFI